MAGQYDLPYTGPQVESLLAKVTELESEMPTKTSDLTNDSGFITAADVPTKTSDLTNDSGFITNAPVAAEAARAQAAEALLATIASLQAEITRATGVEGTLQGLIDGITAKIPSTATAQNQLADKDFVNSSISTNTAEFKGTYNSLSELQAVTANENDYGFVVSTDAAGNTVYSRYKYSGGSWRFEYNLNNSSFTAAQWAAINSAVTAELVAKLSALPDNATLTAALAAKQDVIDDLSSIRSKANSAYQKPSGGIPKTDLADAVQTSLGKADSAIQDVSDKADKDTDAVEGNVAQFDANGNPVDGSVPVENIAQKDGYYGGMTVGAAENLVGRGVVEADIQGIRTSAGTEDIGNGAAMIREVRGKSMVWNQLLTNGDFANGVSGWEAVTGGYGTLAVENGVLTLTKSAQTGTAAFARKTSATRPAVFTSHKYYMSALVKTNTEGKSVGFGFLTIGLTTGGNGSYLTQSQDWERLSRITSPVNDTDFFVLKSGNASADIGTNGSFKNVVLIDLTLIFGAGNEPATVEEVERIFFLPYYGYNKGTIINNEATGLRTRGFNLYNPVTGKAVLPGKYSDYPYEYEICGAFTSISFEDYAGNVSVPELSDGRFFNVDAPGVLTVVGGNATDTCVHLVWSGWRNYGEPDYIYEPYWENTLPINIKAITGKLNGEGESVVIFPNGMRGVGTAYDRLIVDPDGFARRAEVKMGIVDLGTRTYTKTSANYFWAAISAMKTASANGVANLMAIPYQAVSYNALTGADYNALTGADEVMAGFTTNGQNRLYINDSAYAESDATTFKAAMSGVELVYELATPQVYVLDEPIAMTYPVDDFGTEAKLPVDTAALPTAPLRFAVTYPFNAVDKLRRLPTNYLSKESTEALLGALQEAGIIGGYTMTWNADTEHYAFTITPPSPTPDEAND